MPSTNMSEKSTFLVFLILGQLLIVIVISGYNFLACTDIFRNRMSQEKFSFVTLLLAVVITSVTLMVFNEVIELSKQQLQAKMSEQKLKDSQDLVQVLRANQHDFMNHLQILYSAAQLGKIELVDEYFKGIVKDVKEISSISKIIYPEIAALIYSKVTKSEELTNKVNVDINTNLENLKIKTFDLSKVLRNLLDNAIDALSQVDISERELLLKIIETETNFQFIVSNFRPVIPEEILINIFDLGFTTKGEKGSGLGLYNVKQIVEKYHGKVEVVSRPEVGTSFIVTIQKYL